MRAVMVALKIFPVNFWHQSTSGLLRQNVVKGQGGLSVA
jgi:hypothetical protein